MVVVYCQILYLFSGPLFRIWWFFSYFLLDSSFFKVEILSQGKCMSENKKEGETNKKLWRRNSFRGVGLKQLLCIIGPGILSGKNKRELGNDAIRFAV